jgi:hypothetical protein
VGAKKKAAKKRQLTLAEAEDQVLDESIEELANELFVTSGLPHRWLSAESKRHLHRALAALLVEAGAAIGGRRGEALASKAAQHVKLLEILASATKRGAKKAAKR